MCAVWDSHVHLFPSEAYQEWDKWAARDPWFAALTRPDPEGKGAAEAWCTPEEALAAADLAGIDGLVMQGWYWNDPGLMTFHNDFMAQAVQNHPGRLLAFASVNPNFGEDAVKEVQRCAALGFAGIGELGPGGNGYNFDSPCLREVIACAEAEKLPVCIHCGEPVGHPYPGRDATPLEPLVRLIEQFPGVKFILAHLGGGLPFYELNPKIHNSLKSNVWYDLAANPLLYDLRSVKIAAELVGSSRLLYGSDFPLTLYPSRCRTPDFTLFMNQLQTEAGLSQAEQTALFAGNLSRVLETDLSETSSEKQQCRRVQNYSCKEL